MTQGELANLATVIALLIVLALIVEGNPRLEKLVRDILRIVHALTEWLPGRHR